MGVSFVQNAMPQPLPARADAARSADSSPIAAASSGSQQQGGMDLEDRARLFRTLLAAPDSSSESASANESAGPTAPPDTPRPEATEENGHPYHTAEHPQGGLSARDLAMAAIWSGSGGRSRGDHQGDPDSPMTRSRRLDESSESAIGNAAVWSAPVQPAQAAPQGANTAVPLADPSVSLTQLIEIHVRRTLLSMSADGTGTDEVRIELSDAVLPGTSLALRRLPGGWQLSAVADNSQSLQRLTRFAPALVKRFAAASLGSLEIQTTLELEPGE